MSMAQTTEHPWVKDSPNNEVPFSPDGNMLATPTPEAQWRKANPFSANLFYVGYGKHADGVSYFEWRDSNGIKYPMFMIDMDRLIATTTVNKGAASQSRWKFVKRGVNYGIASV